MMNEQFSCVYFEYLHTSGGMGFYNRGILSALQKFHSNIIFLTNTSNELSLKASKINEKNIIPDIKKSNKIYFILKIIFYLFIYRKVNNIKKNRIIVHVFEFNILETFIMLFSRLLYYEVISIIHDAKPLSGKKSFLKSLYLDKCQVIWVHSNYAKINLDSLNVNKPIYQIYASDFDHTYIQKNNNSDYKTINLLFFGQFKESKGLYELVSAFKEIVRYDNSIFLNIHGRAWKFNVNKLMTDSKDIPNLTIKTSYLQTIDVQQLFSVSDIVILPYKEVYNSGVLKRTLCYGKTVIVSDLEPFTDLISNKLNGFIFSHEKEGDFVRCIIDAIEFTRKGLNFNEQNKSYQIFSKQLQLTIESMNKCFV